MRILGQNIYQFSDSSKNCQLPNFANLSLKFEILDQEYAYIGRLHKKMTILGQ